jgi:hypothetical protein
MTIHNYCLMSTVASWPDSSASKAW